jgi:hypothetical protein
MYLSWNIARLLRLSDFRFYSMVKFGLQRSLWSLQVQFDFIKDRKIDIVHKKPIQNSNSKIFYCHLCRRELFIYIWVRRKEDNKDETKEKRRSHCQVNYRLDLL